MKRVSVWMASAAASLLAVPVMAADDVESQLAEMKELVNGLQQKVEAQEEQLEQQGQQLKDAQRVVRADEQESKSGLSAFIDSIEVDGGVAASYNYNFNTPTDNNDGNNDQNAGQSGLFVPFHRDANTFQVDQVWMGIGKPATEESRGGFRFDIFYGATASSYPGGIESEDNARDNGDSTSDLVIDQAYVEYLAPVADANFKLGKFATPVGAEVAKQWSNFNVTRGIVYSMLQPVNHLGLLGTVPLAEFGEIGAGIVNSGGSTLSAPDDNQEKSYLATVKLGDNRANVRGTFIYGSEFTLEQGFSGASANTGDQFGLADVTAWFNPMDRVSLWANYDYLFVANTSYYAHGVALAGRVAVLEDVGVALRGEYVNESPSSSHGTLISQDPETSEIWSVTGTVDYALTSHLKLRSELRWDKLTNGATGEGEKEFAENNPNDFQDNDQLVWLIAAEYIF